MKRYLKAVMPILERQNAINHGGKKETVNRLCVVGKVTGEMRTVVDARFYMGRSVSASTVYASVWVHGVLHVSGHGTANGCGYHKESAALEAAIHSAGIQIFGSVYPPAGERPDFKKRAYIGGAGDAAMREALLAIARAVGANGKLMVV